ncbi:hypothetical protein CSC35_0123 [Enterobacter hormaechei]|nr:hypothetical protein CSC35_0123 [Enterobacter hormaechei]
MQHRALKIFFTSNMSGEFGDMTGVLVECTFANTPVVSP